MKALVLIVFLSIFSSIVAAAVYGASQVSPSTWDYAVIVLVTPVGVGTGLAIGASGVARIVAARHRPPDKHVTMIDKAVFTGSERQLPPPW